MLISLSQGQPRRATLSVPSLPRLPLKHLLYTPGHERGIGVIGRALCRPDGFSMIADDPFGEAVGAMGPVRYLDEEVGGDGECASVKEFMIPRAILSRPCFVR
jgi:hypothetical protein